MSAHEGSAWQAARESAQRSRRDLATEEAISAARAEPDHPDAGRQREVDARLASGTPPSMPKASASLYDEAMVCGLIRAAQLLESLGDLGRPGKICDDESREALAYARRAGLAPAAPEFTAVDREIHRHLDASLCRACGANREMIADGQMLVLTGAALAAYQRLRVASASALQAQRYQETSGQELRDAFGALCQTMAGG